MWPTELVNLPSAALLRAVLLGVTVVSGLQYGVERRHPQVCGWVAKNILDAGGF